MNLQLENIKPDVLLAKILQNLDRHELEKICTLSKKIRNICEKYQLFERLTTDVYYILDNSVKKIKIKDPLSFASISCGAGGQNGVITFSGDVYMFGNGEYGALGDGDKRKHKVPYPKKIEGMKDVVGISCGDHHTGLVITSGKVYMFGSNMSGELGTGKSLIHSEDYPQEIEGIENIALVSCGPNNTGLVSKSGEVYIFGENTPGRMIRKPQEIKELKNVVSISCGYYYTGFLTTLGEVYIIGKDNLTPKKIEDIPPIVSISCGAYHMGMVSFPERRLTLKIDCQYCETNAARYYAVYRNGITKVFCSKRCQEMNEK